MSLVCGVARADFYTYFEWERFDIIRQRTYVAGLFDNMMTFLPDENPKRTLIADCVRKSRMDDGQMASLVKSYADRNPHEKASSVSLILSLSLFELCGPRRAN